MLHNDMQVQIFIDYESYIQVATNAQDIRYIKMRRRNIVICSDIVWYFLV